MVVPWRAACLHSLALTAADVQPGCRLSRLPVSPLTRLFGSYDRPTLVGPLLALGLGLPRRVVEPPGSVGSPAPLRQAETRAVAPPFHYPPVTNEGQGDGPGRRRGYHRR